MIDLDERELRRPDWVGGRPIRLSDAQEWLMPPVDFSWVKPGMEPTGRWFGMEPWRNPGDDVMRLLFAITRIHGATMARWDMAGACYNLACALLRLNYRLDDDDLRELIPFHPDRLAMADEHPLEASESMMTCPDVFTAFWSHIDSALRNCSAEGIACGHVLNHIKTAEVMHIYPGA